jgi:TetR/AcrR family transcriptional regulator, mexCD-oprJ operon repressor
VTSITQRKDTRKATAERNVEAILDGAERLLRHGRAATISAVAKEAGVSRVTVYAHFEDRQRIVEAVVTRAVDHVMASLDAARPADGPAAEALERLLAASWEQLAANQEIARAAAAELSGDAMRRAHEGARAVLQELIERGRREGAFRTDVPAEWLITSFLALIHAATDEVRSDTLDSRAALDVLLLTVTDLFAGRD